MAGICLAAAATVTPVGSEAGEVEGTVNSISQRSSDGLIVVWINGTNSGRPACATHGYGMIRDENSQVGRNQFAMLVAAQDAPM